MPLASEESAHSLPLTIWLTGLSGAGKTTISKALQSNLQEQGRQSFVLDGDVLRQGLCANLGFSHTDRSENIRRTAEVAAILNAAGVISIVALISPFCSDRARARQIIGPDRFLEIYLSTPIEECERRDAKGLYGRARRGEIPDFTGVSSPYEAPQAPHAAIDTSSVSLEEAVSLISKLL